MVLPSTRYICYLEWPKAKDAKCRNSVLALSPPRMSDLFRLQIIVFQFRLLCFLLQIFVSLSKILQMILFDEHRYVFLSRRHEQTLL